MISIIIPIYNEENRLKDNARKIFAFLGQNTKKNEIIFVDDGSTDLTPAILLSLQKEYPIKIVRHKHNEGKGAAIKTGINKASGDLIFFTDVDLSVPIHFINLFLDLVIEKDDVIIGTRVAIGSKIEKKQFFLRELLGGGFTLFSNLLLGVGVSDFTCGFKLFRKKAALEIFSHQQIHRWAFDAESLYLAKKYNFHIKEVPVTWRHNKGSKVKFPGDIIETIVCLFQIRLNDFLGKYD